MRGRVAHRANALQASYETIVVNTRGRPRRRTLHGRQYLVVDATILREGVLNGSNGPLYYPPDEIAANPGVWNHVPIVAWHPKDANGRHTLARDPAVLEEYGLGLLFNDSYDPAAKARNVEAWFDEARTANFDRRLKDEHKVLPRLRAGQPIELSTGLFTKKVPGAGTFNAPSGKSRPYTHTARNYRPDHLAALPDQPGACSVLDGCGFNINAAGVDWKKIGDELASKGLMPGYGQIFLNDEDERPGERVWYVGGDGDEKGFDKVVESTLKAAGAKEVTYEAEGFPPKDQSWVQVYPKRRPWVTLLGAPGEQTGNDWSDAARQAAAVARGETPPATAPASVGSYAAARILEEYRKANEASARGDHAKAAEHHNTAAELSRPTKNVDADPTVNANPEGCNQHTGAGCSAAVHTGNDPSHARLNAASAASRANIASGHANSMSTDPKAFEAAEKARRLGSRALAGHGAAQKQVGGTSSHAVDAGKAHVSASTAHAHAAMRLGADSLGGKAHQTAAELHGIAAHRFRHSAHTLKMVGNMDTTLLGRLIASVWNSVSGKSDVTGNAGTPSAGLDMTPQKACKILKDGEVQGHPLTEKQRGMFGALCGKMTKNAAGEDEWADGAGFDWQLYLVENGHAVGDVLELDALLTDNVWSDEARQAAALARKKHGPADNPSGQFAAEETGGHYLGSKTVQTTGVVRGLPSVKGGAVKLGELHDVGVTSHFHAIKHPDPGAAAVELHKSLTEDKGGLVSSAGAPRPHGKSGWRVSATSVDGHRHHFTFTHNEAVEETTNASVSGDSADPDDYTGHQTEYPKNCPLCGYEMKAGKCTNCGYVDAVTNASYVGLDEGVKVVGPPADGKCPVCGATMKDDKCQECGYSGMNHMPSTARPGKVVTGNDEEVTAPEDEMVVENTWSDKARAAAAEARRLGDHADKMTKKVALGHADHSQAAGAHEAAAEHYANHTDVLVGAAGKAAHHAKMANYHSAKAGMTRNEEVTNEEDPDMATKTENVKYLVTNCECWKGKEAALNAMSEAELDSWRKYHDKAKKNEAVVNSLPDLGLTVNQAGQVEKSWSGTVDFNDPNVREGVCKEMFNMTANDATVLVGFAKQVEQKERFNLVRKLTANIKDPKAQEARAKQLLKLDTQQLQDRVQDLELNASENPVVATPTGNAEDDQYQRFVQSYFSGGSREGSQGAPVPTGNRGNPNAEDAPDVDDDPRPMPTMNYDELSPTGAKLRKARAG